MLFEAIAATLSLDMGWWVNVIMSNLFWVFGFMVAAYCFYGNKKMLSGFIIITFLIWQSFDFNIYTGWVWASATFLMLYYITRLALLGFIENIPRLQKRLPFILSMQFVVLFIVYNIFLRTW